MARFKTKQELVDFAESGYQKLMLLMASLPLTEQERPFTFDISKEKGTHWQRDKNIRDCLIHLYEWHELLINWVNANEQGIKKAFLPIEYNWKTYDKMNIEFFKKHQNTPLAKAKELLNNSHKQTLDILNSIDEDKLFASNTYAGNSTIAQYFISATVGHYDWAIKKVKKHANEKRKYYEAYDDRYKVIHGKGLRWFSDKHSKIVEDIINKYQINKEMKILEIGCGEGRDATYLLKKGYNLLATDISEVAIKYCKNNYPEKEESFLVLNCLSDGLNTKYDFIYSVAVLHMLLLDEDRKQFYKFIYEQLDDNGIALVCIQGNGKEDWKSDIKTAFELQERTHSATGQSVLVAGTSYRKSSFENLFKEINDNQLSLIESGLTTEVDYPEVMYVVVKK